MDFSGQLLVAVPGSQLMRLRPQSLVVGWERRVAWSFEENGRENGLTSKANT
jgi:hypothetical protein